MSQDEASMISVEEVDKALSEIENKYSTNVKISKNRSSFDEAIVVLSKEFDSLGLPPVDATQSLTSIFRRIVKNSHSLVQIHRKTLSHMKDVNIDNRNRDCQNGELNKKLEEYKTQILKSGEKCNLLHNRLQKCSDELNDVKRKEISLKEELVKTKRYYISKQNEQNHQVKKLANENQKLKEMFGKDIGSHVSKDDIALNLLKTYKAKEEIYKGTIHKLEQNNKELLEEIFSLKEELALTLCATRS